MGLTDNSSLPSSSQSKVSFSFKKSQDKNERIVPASSIQMDDGSSEEEEIFESNVGDNETNRTSGISS